MPLYPKQISERIATLRTIDIAASVDASATSASLVCGCFARFGISVDAATKVVSALKFESNGCGYMLAAGAVLKTLAENSSLAELHGLDDRFLRGKINAELGEFPECRRQCADICIDAIHRAFAKYRSQLISEFHGDVALICTCFGVDERTVEAVIRKNGATTVDEVTAACNAGGGCGSCRMLIDEMIDAAASESL